VLSNISEGFESSTKQEFLNYLYIAKASAGEVRAQLYIASDIEYINSEEFKYLNFELRNSIILKNDTRNKKRFLVKNAKFLTKAFIFFKQFVLGALLLKHNKYNIDEFRNSKFITGTVRVEISELYNLLVASNQSNAQLAAIPQGIKQLFSNYRGCKIFLVVTNLLC